MAKAAVTKKTSLSANGILSIENGVVGIENTETGENYNLQDLLSDFKDRLIKLSVNYDEDYE